MSNSRGELEAVLSFMVKGPRDGDPPTSDELGAWWDYFLDTARPFHHPIGRALIGGRVADRVGYAFTAGYISAIHRLVPTIGMEETAALCVSEEGGAHPRNIKATLTERETRKNDHVFSLSGEKSFVTNADLAEHLVVAASVGETAGGKNDIRIVVVGRSSPGVTITSRDPLPFVPEVVHGRVRFDDVRVPAGAILPGDGYTGYVKPFRTIEDVHVLGGIVGYLANVGMRFRWPKDAIEEILELAASAWSLAGADALDPGVHVALGGLFRRLTSFLEESGEYWEKTDDATRERWKRDRPLLDVAGKARSMRLEAAWKRLEGAEE
ncbi:MAG: acyl-CoA dehydrogenase family protein [Deltaproteobacteria bacterium]|nr:acyl-CoA dehydrogenase family protein [Candidatus Zymogenaceae bacterium]